MANRRRSWAISGEEDVLSRLRTLQMSSGLGESAIRNRNNNNKNIRTEDDSNCTRWRAKLTPLVVASYSKSIASIKRWNGHFLVSRRTTVAYEGPRENKLCLRTITEFTGTTLGSFRVTDPEWPQAQFQDGYLLDSFVATPLV
ncbi:hypothetical protein IV203_022050 [Nitzschia inconspicua]|uniref:Uncharacterized protein n=1 Tax=Nitzschia inconspicua TaxID=303405 RepID=A0A9K3KHS6_9STRA|nr:hypothetical protein IV203_022050 [Nitzschia inconspicua]